MATQNANNVAITGGSITGAITGMSLTTDSSGGSSPTEFFTGWRIVMGQLGNDLMDKTSRNILGILPIPFANMPGIDESRGHSDYERILYDLKDYHDIDYARSEILTKFKPKMIQEVSDVKEWMRNNGYDSLTAVDPWSIDFVVNIAGKEKTTFETARGATESYEKALENKYWKLDLS